MSSLPRLVLGALLTLLLVCGCGDSSGGKLVPVKGKVIVGDKPLTRGSVSFRLQNPSATSAAEPSGTIEADGTYTLYTNQKPGAPVGKYYVIVSATEEIDPKNPSATPKTLINTKYGDPANKLLSVDVVENAAADAYDLKLKP